ncbi:hypothetical protein [Thalassovita taeanensis]|uniref:hypothetical protein n=1 Tax=Thalassovita taeanensis TaxID=657014 RepID=UPI0011148335|nr:hypothetical protein [Thalassovita taeanensis]
MTHVKVVLAARTTIALSENEPVACHGKGTGFLQPIPSEGLKMTDDNFEMHIQAQTSTQYPGA